MLATDSGKGHMAKSVEVNYHFCIASILENIVQHFEHSSWLLFILLWLITYRRMFYYGFIDVYILLWLLTYRCTLSLLWLIQILLVFFNSKANYMKHSCITKKLSGQQKKILCVLFICFCTLCLTVKTIMYGVYIPCKSHNFGVKYRYYHHLYFLVTSSNFRISRTKRGLTEYKHQPLTSSSLVQFTKLYICKVNSYCGFFFFFLNKKGS